MYSRYGITCRPRKRYISGIADHASGTCAAIGSNPLKRSGEATLRVSKRARARARPHFTRSLDENDFACTRERNRTLARVFPRIPVAHFSVRPYIRRTQRVPPHDRSFFAVTPRRALGRPHTRERNVPLERDLSSHNHVRRPANERRSNDAKYTCIPCDHAVTNFESVMPLPRVLDHSPLLPVRHDVRRGMTTLPSTRRFYRRDPRR